MLAVTKKLVRLSAIDDFGDDAKRALEFLDASVFALPILLIGQRAAQVNAICPLVAKILVIITHSSSSTSIQVTMRRRVIGPVVHHRTSSTRESHCITASFNAPRAASRAIVLS
ncbi:hypothetical protein Y047_5989 [Burkholderia pseudomallei MSHR3016]|nr:hypothetical protein Y047_5989 [Burkholderia pseudomallei MSHR3016]